jgi:hypothetical protein
MPMKMGMFFDNNPYSSRAVAAYLASMQKAEEQNKKSMARAGSLSGSMVGRIFFAKPGCGSCGK